MQTTHWFHAGTGDDELNDPVKVFNVYRTATAGTYTDTVVRARGADTIYQGATGNLKIAMAWAYNDPYYFYQQAWTKFIPG